MKDSWMRGKYIEIDFKAAIKIQKNDHSYMEVLLDAIINERMFVHKFRYRQGFLDIEEPESLADIPKILIWLKDSFFDSIEYGKTLEKNITKYIMMIQKDIKITEDMISYVWEIFDRFEIQMYFRNLCVNTSYILKLINEQPRHLFEIPLNVKGVIFAKRPSTLEIDIMDSKDLPHVVSIKPYVVGKHYKIKLYDIGLLPGLMLEETPLNRGFRGKFQLGVCIHTIKDISKNALIDPDYIVVEPEKSYIQTSGIAYLDQRQSFYKHLLHSFPNSDIIVSLPKLLLLDIYFNQGNEIKLDGETLINHSVIYETELISLFKYPHKHIMLSIPDIEDVIDFDQIRKGLITICQQRFENCVKIGLEVNTEYTTYNLSSFKKFDFGMINMNEGFDMILPNDKYSSTYYMKYSELRGILYRKSKDTYIIGKDLEEPITFKSLMYKGFRKFTVKTELFEVYNSMIHRYNNGERLYRK